MVVVLVCALILDIGAYFGAVTTRPNMRVRGIYPAMFALSLLAYVAAGVLYMRSVL